MEEVIGLGVATVVCGILAFVLLKRWIANYDSSRNDESSRMGHGLLGFIGCQLGLSTAILLVFTIMTVIF